MITTALGTIRTFGVHPAASLQAEANDKRDYVVDRDLDIEATSAPGERNDTDKRLDRAPVASNPLSDVFSPLRIRGMAAE